MKAAQSKESCATKETEDTDTDTHPFKATTESPINIINGCVSDKNVNVHNAVAIGQQIVAVFTASLPAGFYKTS